LKGQISIEFLASFFLFLIAIVSVFQYVSGDVPQFDREMEDKNLHFEAKYTSDQMLTQPGSHNHGGNVTNWEKNLSTRNSLNSLGLASEYLVLEEDKLGNISTVGGSKVNYSQFRSVTDVKNDYHFRFVWLPLVKTSESFDRGDPPINPGINEPAHPLYDSSGLEIHYGSVRLEGTERHFLVTSHQGEYNTTYISDSWDFTASDPVAVDGQVTFGGRDFSINNIQNREYSRGGLISLSSQIKNFGASIDRTENLVKINRYVTFNAEGSEKEPMRVEVLTW